ncbi:hypothetical protein [Agromyces lapidis]|uniref:Uncharacterized protein n=1 Tax=Agromyces lapidis TaxID=279574 RepID=A0ABV5SSY1_9MICO|nr:hypothetical protein [Agromyces lapidis]
MTYYFEGEVLFQNEYALLPPVVGQGVLHGKFYRVADVWEVNEKHAPVTHGIAVFLEKVETPAVFREVDPAYYA